jgi:hypothetical protein
MLPQCVQTRTWNPYLRYTVSWIVAAVLAIQSLAAADAWSRVTRLKLGEDWVYVALTSGEREEGRFLGADNAGITNRAIGRGDITVARDLVLQAAIDKKQKRRWFSIPLIAVAAAIGAFAGYKIARHFKCSNKADGERKACEQVNALIVIGSALVPAGAIYALTNLGQSKKGIQVIYDKPTARTHPDKRIKALRKRTPN